MTILVSIPGTEEEKEKTRKDGDDFFEFLFVFLNNFERNHDESDEEVEDGVCGVDSEADLFGCESDAGLE